MVTPPAIRDVVKYGCRMYLVIEGDRYGFFTAAHEEGETIVKHFSELGSVSDFTSMWISLLMAANRFITDQFGLPNHDNVTFSFELQFCGGGTS